MQLPEDPTTLVGEALLALVQCPPPRPTPWEPKEQTSPSALQDHGACARRWGHTYLEGRRGVDLEWSYASRIPEPAKAPKGCSAVEKATAEDLKKAWNKVRRPALGTDVHDLLGAYMVQNTPGKWHPPMPWREVEWTSHAGRIARPACDVLPDPRSLVDVHTELAVDVEAPGAWCADCGGQSSGAFCQHHRPWPKMPGYYDLITVEPDHEYTEAGFRATRVRFRLWDFKTTSSFDWAKTEDELREDPQVLLYALHAMQTFGLQEIECNWVYLRTEDSPKAYVVTVVVTRAEAEQAVLEMAETAAEVVDKVRLFKAGRLRVVDLEMNVAACTAYGGCVYHISKGGPCDAKVSPGKAMKQKAELDAKIRARKQERKQNEMALSFGERKAAKDKEKAAAGEAPSGVATGAEGDANAAPEQPADKAEAKPEAKAEPTVNTPPKPKATKVAPVPSAGVHATVDGFAFEVPASSALGKQLAKAAKGLQAAAMAFEGE